MPLWMTDVAGVSVCMLMPMTDSLHRPRLRPGTLLAWRDDSTLQIGWGPCAVAVQQAPPRLTAWLRHLDGMRGVDAAVGLADRWGIAADDARTILRHLAAAGLLWQPPVEVAATVVGGGRAAAQLSEALTQMGVRVGDGGCTVYLQGDVPTTWDAPSTAGLLPVWFGVDEVRVGPVLVAGAGPCQSCVDGWRQSWDASWPLLAAQSRSEPSEVEPRLATPAAAFIAALLRRGPDVFAGVEAILQADDPLPKWRVWDAWPDCPCRPDAA